jgi:hypothetical protein
MRFFLKMGSKTAGVRCCTNCDLDCNYRLFENLLTLNLVFILEPAAVFQISSGCVTHLYRNFLKQLFLVNVRKRKI